MVAPMSDIQASCAQCHPNDLASPGQVYVPIWASDWQQVVPQPRRRQVSPPQPLQACAIAGRAGCGSCAGADPVPPTARIWSITSALQPKCPARDPTNWGNVILLVMIGAMLDRWRGACCQPGRLDQGLAAKIANRSRASFLQTLWTWCRAIARLKPNARRSLRRLLEKPDATAARC